MCLDEGVLHLQTESSGGTTPAKRVPGVGLGVQPGPLGKPPEGAHKDRMSQGLQLALGILSAKQGALGTQARAGQHTSEGSNGAEGGAGNSMS